jgi:lycopene beta-cyclase
MPATHFDIAIIGAGAAGLHLALAMRKEPFFEQKRILILDKSAKEQNDRTWCFWERGEGLWDHLLQQSWSKGDFFYKETAIPLTLSPYQYKMIRSIDFYNYAKQEIASSPIFHWKKEDVQSIQNGTPIQINSKEAGYTADYVFDSRIPEEFNQTNDKYTRILQHFKGWIIRTKEDCFDPDRFTMMDFRLLWPNATSFTYVLPINKRKALVEFTLFSPGLLKMSDYENMLRRYISDVLKLHDFEIVEEEYGVIPMSDFPFEKYSEGNHIRIGTGGGWVKPSTGYSFKNCERNSRKIVLNLKKGTPANQDIISKKFRFYDSLFLDVLQRKNELGPSLFNIMYSKYPVQKIFSYLDEQTSFAEDLGIMVGFPWPPFLHSFVKYSTR